jgi:hypothetical protein
MNLRSIYRVALRLVLAAGIVYCCYVFPRSFVWAAVKTKLIDATKGMEVAEGDFVFQHLPGHLLKVIADVTQSPYSHCGIVVMKEGRFYVLEAIGPVTLTPLNEWIHRGIASRVTLVRLKEKYRKDIPLIIMTGYKYIGRPYDLEYAWDDEKIYCSELIYKAAWEGAGIRLAAFRELGQMNWKPHEQFIRLITGGQLPLERKMITPHDLARSQEVELIYSNFPKKTE